ncbi:MAG TPA: rRNA maturation RNase YbeY [Candidatus Dormibacteraeota bacterium]
MRVTLAVAAELGVRERAAVRSARLGTLLRHCGAELGVDARTSLSVRLSDDAELQRLNGAFRGVDSPTDVLAFPPGEPGYLGDIAISVERALDQADDGAAELRLLAVHGLLHCLGHEHHDAEDAARMTAATRRLLPGEEVPDLVPAAPSEAR